MIPHTAGFAVCGALLPTNGTLTGGAMPGNGASGTLGRAPATFSTVLVTEFCTLEGAPLIVSVAPGTASGAWRKAPNAFGAMATKRTKTQWTAIPGMIANKLEQCNKTVLTGFRTDQGV